MREFVKPLVFIFTILIATVLFWIGVIWLINLDTNNRSCADFPQFRYENGSVPVKCYEEYKVKG